MSDVYSTDYATSGAGLPPVNIDALVKQANPDYGVDVNKLRTDLGNVKRDQATETEGAASRQLDAMRRGYADVEAAHAGIKPVDVQPWNADKERAQRIQSPLEAFGSNAGMFAMLASAFTGQPIENTLNAGAAAINAVRANDIAGYEAAHKAWQENLDIAFKRHEIEQQAFNNAITKLKADPIAAGAELKAVAARFGAKAEMAMIDAGMIPEVMEVQKAKAKSAENLLNKLPDLLKVDETVRGSMYARQEIENQNKLRADNGLPPLSPMEQASIIGQVKQAMTAKPLSAPLQELSDINLAAKRLFDEAAANGEPITMDEARLQAKQARKDALVSPDKRELMARIDKAKQEYMEKNGLTDESQIPADALNKINAEANRKATPFQTGTQLSPEAVESAAERYIKTGTFPPNLGRGTQGREDTVAIQNRAAEIMTQRGLTMDQVQKGWQQNKAQQIAIQRFESGPQGNVIRSLNVTIDHLATIDELAAALKNGNMQAANSISQAIAAQFGSPVPTNLEAAKQIVGPEIIKALGVAGAGSEKERAHAGDIWDKAKSPEQLAQATATIKKLLAGQLAGIKQQYVQSTGLPEENFNSMMLPATLKELDVRTVKPAAAAPLISNAKEYNDLQPGTNYIDARDGLVKTKK